MQMPRCQCRDFQVALLSTFKDNTLFISNPRSRNSQVQEAFLAPSDDNQTSNYDTEHSNHHPSSLSLRSKGLSHSKKKW